MPVEDNKSKPSASSKKYVSLVTQKILCNKEFSFVKGEAIPKGIDENFIQSLISSNLIK